MDVVRDLSWGRGGHEDELRARGLGLGRNTTTSQEPPPRALGVAGSGQGVRPSVERSETKVSLG